MKIMLVRVRNFIKNINLKNCHEDMEVTLYLFSRWPFNSGSNNLSSTPLPPFCGRLIDELE